MPEELAGPLDRPLTRQEWDKANEILRTLRNSLEAECKAAAGFCKELADLRIILDNVRNERDKALTEVWEHDKHVEFLREGIREISYLSGQETIRDMCEALLRGDEEIPE